MPEFLVVLLQKNLLYNPCHGTCKFMIGVSNAVTSDTDIIIINSGFMCRKSGLKRLLRVLMTCAREYLNDIDI